MKISIRNAIIDLEVRVQESHNKLVKLRQDEIEGITEVRMTNEDLFQELIEDFDTGTVAMARTMLMQEAKRLIDNEAAVIEEHKTSFISGEYIIQCAKELKALFGRE